MTLDELEIEALKLPFEGRVELVHRILLSFDGSDPEHGRLWREEIERRYRNVEEGTSRLTPADEVLAALRAELR